MNAEFETFLPTKFHFYLCAPIALHREEYGDLVHLILWTHLLMESI